MLLSKPTYWLGHPKSYLCVLPNKLFSGSKYPKLKSLHFENRRTADLAATLLAGINSTMLRQGDCTDTFLRQSAVSRWLYSYIPASECMQVGLDKANLDLTNPSVQ